MNQVYSGTQPHIPSEPKRGMVYEKVEGTVTSFYILATTGRSGSDVRYELISLQDGNRYSTPMKTISDVQDELNREGFRVVIAPVTIVPSYPPEA